MWNCSRQTSSNRPPSRPSSAGLAYLASRQNEDGSLAVGLRNAVSIAGLAFLSSGDTPGRGTHGGAINRCINYILRVAEKCGLISLASAASHRPMYDHGFATLFLAEVYGMTPIAKSAKSLRRMQADRSQTRRTGAISRSRMRRISGHHLPDDGPASGP